MTLNRNPDNFFAETEQVAFHVGHIVPGIDFTNDPLMQGRLFSYTDTQLSRLGGPNFHEIPINRPIVPVHNNQRDGIHRMTINKGKSSYNPNTTGGGCPFQAGKMEGGFTSYTERIDAVKIRERSPSFFDHFSQATLFFNSQSEPEKMHIIDALRFELGKVEILEIRQRMLAVLYQVDKGLAAQVAYSLGIDIPAIPAILNHSFPADADPQFYQPVKREGALARSAALSMVNSARDIILTRKIAFLIADGVDETDITTVKNVLIAKGAVVEVIAPRGIVVTAGNNTIMPDKTLLTVSSVLYDAVYIPGGINSSATLEAEADAIHFLNEAFKHCKAIAASGNARQVLNATYFAKKLPEDNDDDTVLREGIILNDDIESLARQFVLAIAQHRFWERERPRKVPA